MNPSTFPAEPDSQIEPPVSNEPTKAPKRSLSRSVKHPRGDRLTAIHAINEEAKARLEVEHKPRWKLSERAKIMLGASAAILFVMGTPVLYWAIQAWRYSMASRSLEELRANPPTANNVPRVVTSPARGYGRGNMPASPSACSRSIWRT